jgi:hypothetical protein
MKIENDFFEIIGYDNKAIPGRIDVTRGLEGIPKIQSRGCPRGGPW